MIRKTCKRATELFIFLALCLTCSCAASANNIFDDTDYARSQAYWRISDGANLTVANGIWTLTPGANNSSNATRSNLSLRPGMEYILSGEMRPAQGSSARVYIEWIHDSNYIHTPTVEFLAGNGSWIPFSAKFTFSGANTAAPYLAIDSANGKVEIRNFTVREVPVQNIPATGGGIWQSNDRVKVLDNGNGGQQISIASGSAWLRQFPVTEPGRYSLKFTVSGEGDAGNVSGYYKFETRIHPANEHLTTVSKADDVLPNAKLAKELVFEVADDNAVISVEWVNGSAGVLVLEDVSIAPKPLSAEDLYHVILDTPVYRGTIFTSRPVPAFTGTLTFDANVAACRNELLDSTGKVLFTQDGADFNIPATDLPAGEYELFSQWLQNDGSIFSRTTPLAIRPPAEQEVVIGEDRQLYVNGKPFFPVVFYQMQGIWEQREIFWLEVAASGVNTLLLEREVTVENLDLAEKCGLKIMAFLGNIGIPGLETEELWREKLEQTLTPEFVNHPALLGYYLVDEPNWGGRSLNQLLKSYEILKEADPNHPIWINAAPRGDLADHRAYSTAADIYGVDIYPVPTPDPHGDLPNKELSVVGDYAAHIAEALDWRKPNWMVLQAFAWGTLNNYTPVYPTREQLRFMVYDALLNGGTAIVFWGQVYILKPDFYRDLLAVTSELHAISGLWANSSKYWLEESTPQLELQLMEADGNEYIIALNRTAAPAPLTLRVPWQGKTIQVHFENRLIDCTDSYLDDTVPPFSVRIYSVADLPVPQYELPEFNGGGYADYEVFACDDAGWIWAEAVKDTAGSKVNLCREFTVDPEREISEVTLVMGADDYAEIVINGERLGPAGNCRFLKRFRLQNVTPGRNYIAVEAVDGGGLPCGVIGTLEIKYADGRTEVIPTDTSWMVVPEKPADWSTVNMNALTEHAFVVSGLHSGKWFNAWGDNLLIQ